MPRHWSWRSASAGSTARSAASTRRTSSSASRRAARSEEPQNAALAYFSLGERAEADAQAYLTDYYAWLGEETAGFIAGSAAKDPETVQQYVSAFERVGCQELFLFPSSSDPQQVDLLADALDM